MINIIQKTGKIEILDQMIKLITKNDLFELLIKKIYN